MLVSEMVSVADTGNDLIGTLVQYQPGGPTGEVAWFGILEYVTPDGWAGIRQPHAGNRIDESRADLTFADPT